MNERHDEAVNGGTLAFVAAAVLSLGVILAGAVFVIAGSSRPSPGIRLEDMAPNTRQAYELATQHQDLFVHLPCYCGCALLQEPHRSLVDCFISPNGGYDGHAASCLTCVDIALTAWEASESGLDHAQVRALVDATFSNRGPGTTTALP
jgi:hypothetical protein